MAVDGWSGITEEFSQGIKFFFTPARTWVRYRTKWAAVVCLGFVTVVLNDFSITIVLR